MLGIPLVHKTCRLAKVGAVLLGLFAGCFALAGQTAGRTGTYKFGEAKSVDWSIGQTGLLTWDGQPYSPVGASTAETSKAAQLKAAGISDVLLNVPVSKKAWPQEIADLEKANLRYLLRLNSLAPAAKGFTIDPQSYRVASVTRPQTFRFSIPEAQSAFVVLALKSDGSVSQSGRVPAVNGVIQFEAKYGSPETEYVLLVYPEVETSEFPDFWEGLDQHRDQLLSALKRSKLGPGLRGIVNPLGSAVRLDDASNRLIPSSPYFQMELAQYLQEKYRNIETAARSWGIATGFVQQRLVNGQTTGGVNTSFADMARLVPLWNGNRGIGRLLDPSTNTTYACDSKRSVAWDDLQLAIVTAKLKRYDRLVASIRQIADVPVIQDWAGWAGLYETGDAAIDGIGVRPSGVTAPEIVNSAAQAASSAHRLRRPGWTVATEVSAGMGVPAADLASSLDDLVSLGCRGIFLPGEEEAGWPKIVAEATRLASDGGIAAARGNALFFPENASEPAAAQKLPGGLWWLPSPASGNRIDLGRHYFAYRLDQDSVGRVAIWTDRPGRVKLLLPKSDVVTAQTTDGSDAGLKAVKGGLEVYLGPLPTLLVGVTDIPIPEVAVAETLAGAAEITRMNQTLKRDLMEESMMFRDYNRSLDRNPAGNFALMRALYNRMALKIGDTTWIEAEQTRQNSFSDAVAVGGCSGGGALLLSARLPNENGFYADYNFSVRSREDQEVWVAAKIPSGRNSDLKIQIGGQTLIPEARPVAYYGQGFAWYRLGVSRLAGNTAKLRLTIDGPLGYEYAIDAIVLTPSRFRPLGVRIPDPFQDK